MDLRKDTSAIVSELNAKVLLARHEQGRDGGTVVFHATDSLPRDFARQAEAAFAQKGYRVACKIRMHSARRLSRLLTLESFVKAFGSGEILFDPTHLVARATSLVKLARLLRVEIPEGLGSIGFESRRRTLYVIFNERKYHHTLETLQAVMQKTNAVIAGWQASTQPDFDIAVRIGFDAPPASRLVPVDAASVVYNLRDVFARRTVKFFRATGLAALFGIGTTTAAVAGSNEPAVSQPNMSVLGRGASTDGDGHSDAAIKGTLPIGHSFGLQLEGGVGTDDYHGYGANLFWRDPSVGMVGVFGTKESLDSVDMKRFAAEGELYLNQFTLGATAGRQQGDVKDGTFGRLDLKFYVTPDLVMRAGGEFTPGLNFGRVGVEWRPAFESLPGLSIFADGEFGESGYDGVMAGLKYHFGAKGTTLINRDRREDPDFHILNHAPLKKAKQGYTPSPPV